MRTNDSGNSIPTRPSAPPSTPHTNPPPSNPSSGSGTGTGTGTGSGGNPYLAAQRAAQAKADRQAAQAKHKAAVKYLGQAKTLGEQAAALRLALGKTGFKKALDTRLANITFRTGQRDDILMRGYNDRIGTLEKAAGDNEKQIGTQNFDNLANRARERGNALSEATAQGAGESDMLRAQGMSLRNWNFNETTNTRAFYDTLTSINGQRTDLNVDTLTARANLYGQANADREGQWTDYYAHRSEVYTQLANTYGMQAEQYGNALEMQGSKRARTGLRRARRQSRQAQTGMARATGMAWKDPGVPDRIQNWRGRGEILGDVSNDVQADADTELSYRKPQGATLRSWEDAP